VSVIVQQRGQWQDHTENTADSATLVYPGADSNMYIVPVASDILITFSPSHSLDDTVTENGSFAIKASYL